MTRFKVWNEISDTVIAVEGNEVFFEKVGRVTIEDEGMTHFLNQHVGETVSILRTDIPGREYLLQGVK